MEKRTLGKTGLEVSPLAFGGNVFGWTIGEKRSFELLDVWTESGLNFIDTADSYSNWVPGNKGGESETIIGNWMKLHGNRHKLIISTKVGSELGPGKKGTSKKYIMEAVEASLQRLQTDCIDLYQSHWPDPETPYEETLEAYAQLIQQGKIRAFGTSNFTTEQLTASFEAAKQHSLLPYQTLQPEYNLYDRAGFENGLQQVCLDNNIGVISYFALASGFLTGKYRTEEDLSKSQRGAGIKKYFNERGFRILKALDEVSEKHHTTPASVSIAWLLTRPAITAPIASATSAEQIDAMVEATELRLDAGDLDLLTTASNE
ncbi:MAG TPA: aldo/keto reductase [Flavisolibacter sp.]|nr:aldo/keto reductase [Flavisolibacter sp.]